MPTANAQMQAKNAGINFNQIAKRGERNKNR